MIDEIFDRTYEAGRADLNAGLDAAFRRIVNRIEYQAPWLQRRRKARRA